MMYIKGKNVSVETIRSERIVRKVIMKKGFNDPILTTIKEKKIPYEFMDPDKFNRIFKEPQGIVCEIEDYEYASFDECLKNIDNNSLVLILDSIEDPQNLGNMIRTFETLGGSFIIIPKNRSVSVNETVMKVSSGAYNYVKITEVTNLKNAIEKLKDKGFWVAGADMKGELPYYDLDVKSPLAIVIGSEGFGISRLVRESCDFLIRIPMVGKINSLNASISAAIILSDIIARRKKL